jgi:hypothetical protein
VQPAEQLPVYDRETMRPPSLMVDVQQTKILSWNVAGLRALLKKVGTLAGARWWRSGRPGAQALPPHPTTPSTRPPHHAIAMQSPAALSDLVSAEAADVLCLQEIKLQEEHCAKVLDGAGMDGWHLAWNCSTTKKGYSGTAILSRWANHLPACARGLSSAGSPPGRPWPQPSPQRSQTLTLAAQAEAPVRDARYRH